MDQLLLDEIYDLLLTNSGKRLSLHPLGEVVGGNQDELMPLGRWWMYLSDDVHGPTPEGPGLDYCVQFLGWDSRDRPVLLAGRASSSKFFGQGWPEVSRPGDGPLHSSTTPMGPAHPQVYLGHDRFSIVPMNTPQQ